MRQHVAAATDLARRLEGAKGVRRVHYPGLASHAQHELCLRQMSGGGGIITVELDGGLEQAKRFLTSLRIFTLAESLGGVESLAEHPGLMTHASIQQTGAPSWDHGRAGSPVGWSGERGDLWATYKAPWPPQGGCRERPSWRAGAHRQHAAGSIAQFRHRTV